MIIAQAHSLRSFKSKSRCSLVRDEDLIFDLDELRKPLVLQSNHMKYRIAALRKLHTKVDDNFLDKRIKPRYVVIVADGLNIANFDKRDKKNWE